MKNSHHWYGNEMFKHNKPRNETNFLSIYMIQQPAYQMRICKYTLYDIVVIANTIGKNTLRSSMNKRIINEQ